MTIAVGFKFNGGILLCADTEQSDEDVKSMLHLFQEIIINDREKIRQRTIKLKALAGKLAEL